MSELNPNLIPPATVELEEYLKKHLKGQPQVIKSICQAYTRFISGINQFNEQDKKRPIGVFLLLGPSRTGKTETGRILAQKFHGTKKAITIVDCASYQEKHEIASLIGAPPGYIGYDDKPILSKEKLYAKIPGYETKAPVDKFKSNHKEVMKEDDDEEGIFRLQQFFSLHLDELNLIDLAWQNIDRQYSRLKRQELDKKELAENRRHLEVQREILRTRRNLLNLSYLQTANRLLENSELSASIFTGSSPEKIKKVAIKDKTTTTKAVPVKIASKEDPILVIIFDEIEKAHESVRQFLLHLMEEGRAVLRNGEEIDLSRAFIILTSNIASKLISKATKGPVKIGFSSETAKINLEKLAKGELKKLFSQEFLNRLDATITFNILSPQDFQDILELEIESLSLFLSKIFVDLVISREVKNLILEETAKNPEEQAKALQACFKKHLADPIANLHATGQLTNKKKLAVTLNAGNKIVFKN